MQGLTQIHYPGSPMTWLAREALAKRQPASLRLFIVQMVSDGFFKPYPKRFIDHPPLNPGLRFTPKHESKHLDYFALSEGIVDFKAYKNFMRHRIIDSLYFNDYFLFIASRSFAMDMMLANWACGPNKLSAPYTAIAAKYLQHHRLQNWALYPSLRCFGEEVNHHPQ